MLRDDARRTRATVLRSVWQLMSDTGTAKISVDDIAGRAGVSPASVYRHFGSKQALIDEVSVDRWRRAASWAAGSGKPERALADIVTTLDRFSLMVTDDAEFIAAAGVDVGQTPAAILPVRQEFTQRFQALWATASAAGHVVPWAEPMDIMDLVGGIRDKGRRIPKIMTVINGFCAPRIDAQHLAHAVLTR
ncbi:TetR/AcrR family transcriptional regulator [Microbacterium sp. SYP-A9085]|uniref:TetR/AcrR family transcriptional regulator n=1 Tax=Microbacterium sp. SYP-A9085 TaxID=2664454 RepID=UPI0015623B80|nr:TetR/AcrR family transcriptional regulator [Microbacterium sp. SYP-A9085]